MNTTDKMEELIDAYVPVDLSKDKEELIKWGHALESYGTPVDFVTATYFEDGRFTINSKEYKSKLLLGSNFNLRRELMSKQEAYTPKSAQKDLNIDSCFLCQNIAQAEDSKTHSDVPDNKVYELDEYFILPNRYPATWGHSLWIPKTHDELGARVQPINGNQYNSEPDKTRGKILTAKELEQLFDICDEKGYIAVRNHVLDAMSIPGHDHFHLQLDKMPFYDIATELAKFDYKNLLSAGIYRASNTPLDTLIISKDDVPNFADKAANILKNMEMDNQVFLLAYIKGDLFITPRINIGDNRRISVGGGVHLHSFDVKTSDLLPKVKKHIPLKGEYNWTKYL